MKKGFYTIMAAQFFSSLADNALFIAAIAMLSLLQGPPWLTPLLKFFFTISYVVLAFLVGAFADSMPKGRVMFATNLVQVVAFVVIYAIGAFFNLAIPDAGARYPHQERNPVRLMVDFSRCFTTLWTDKLGQISLAVTTLFWGAGATLQLLVLRWAESSLNLPLDKGAVLQGISAFGIAAGAPPPPPPAPPNKPGKNFPSGDPSGRG